MSFVALPRRLDLVREGLLQEGPHLARARTQAAVVRALLDQVERYDGSSMEESEVRYQLVEEIGRLRCQVDEAKPPLK